MERQALTKEKDGASRSAGPHATPRPHASTPVQRLLSIQRTLGNRAACRLLQPKLRVSRPDDEHEQEADRVAEQVMLMPEPAPASARASGGARAVHLDRASEEEEEEEREEPEELSRKAAAGLTHEGPVAVPRIQRACRHCEEEVQRQAEEGEEEEEEEDELQLQAKREAGRSHEAPAKVEEYIGGLSHGGRPLPAPVRAFFEPRFGYDFSRVRVHTDAGAAESAKSVGALAYTVGPDVVFGAGQYSPESAGGRRLLAHELTHVVQQGHARPSAAPAREHLAPSGERVAPAADASSPAAPRVAGRVVQRQLAIDPTVYTLTQQEADAMSVETLERHITDVRAALERTSIIETIYDTLEANLIILEAALRKKTTPADPLEKDDLEWDEEGQEEGTVVQLPGIVSHDGYDKEKLKYGPVTDVALRKLPSTSSTVVKRLPVNTRVFVDRELLGKWYYVILDDGTDGYVSKDLINTQMPDPDARLHRIKPGEGALDIVRTYYKGDAIEWGQDARFYVNVLVLVNQSAGRKWIYKPSEDASWDETKTIAGGQIWIPGVEFAKSLGGVVSSGSISYEVWSTVRDFAVGVVAFIAGLLHGILESLFDILVGLYDLVKMIYDIIKSLVTGEIISDIKQLWKDVEGLSLQAIGDAIVGWLDNKWNKGSTWSKWHFRGWLIGYAIAEIALMFFTGGAATAVKWAGKGAKIVKLISELPAVIKLGKAAKALTGPAADTARSALKGVKALSAAHAWANKTLRIPYKILVNVTEEAAESLRRLPTWAKERFADLRYDVMRWLLGCSSPCKVDVHKIEEYLKNLAPAAKAAAKTLSTEAEIIAAMPKGMATSKILAKLKTRPALVKAITEAKLTDADFVKLADFLSDADKASPAAAYRTFVRYLTNVVPAKVEGDLTKFNNIAAELIKADPRQGAALKGSMFEQFSKLNVPELGGKNFEKVKFSSSKLSKSRTADNFVPDKGEIWEIKHSYSAVPPEQAADYQKIIGMKTPAGDEVKSINYLFPDQRAAQASAYLKNAPYGFRVFYIDPTTKKLVPL